MALSALANSTTTDSRTWHAPLRSGVSTARTCSGFASGKNRANCSAQPEAGPSACISVDVASVFSSATLPVPALCCQMHTHPVHTLGREELCKRDTKEEAKIAAVKLLKTIGLGFSGGTATIQASQADTFLSQVTGNFRSKQRSAPRKVRTSYG